MGTNRWEAIRQSVDGDEPVSIPEAISHLNLPPSTKLHQLEIRNLLDAAEADVRRKVITRDETWDYKIWEFPTALQSPDQAIILPYQSVSSVTSIDYLDDEGTPVSIPAQDYYVVTGNVPGYIVPASVWPVVPTVRPGAVTIRYSAGPNEDQLRLIKVIMLQLCSAWFETRSASFTGTISVTMRMSTERLLDRLDWGSEFLSLPW